MVKITLFQIIFLLKNPQYMGPTRSTQKLTLGIYNDVLMSIEVDQVSVFIIGQLSLFTVVHNLSRRVYLIKKF